MALHVLAGIALVIIAYVMGSVPFAIVIGKWFWHVDVRDHGSGNVGTTNVFRVLGIRAGTLVLIGDMAKGFIPVFIAVQFFPTVVRADRRPGGAARPHVLGLPARRRRQGRGHRRRHRARAGALDLPHRPRASSSCSCSPRAW